MKDETKRSIVTFLVTALGLAVNMSKSQKEIQRKSTQGMSYPPRKRLYTIAEAAEYLGRTHWGVRELITRGAIPYHQTHKRGKIYLDLYDLDRFIEGLKRCEKTAN